MLHATRIAALAAVLVLVAGCAAPDPASQRRAYDVTLNGWAAKEQAPPAAAVEELDEEGAAEALEPPAEAAELTAPTTVVADVQLSILVTNNGGDLEQLTVEISHVDANDREKATYRRTLDVAQIVRGLTSDVTVVLPDVELGARQGEGTAYPDKFAVSVRSEVPAADRHEYPELSAAK